MTQARYVVDRFMGSWPTMAGTSILSSRRTKYSRTGQMKKAKHDSSWQQAGHVETGT